ncbi:putative Radical SAM domain protein [uncultured Alphaproteobacteria bacterium]|uniref:Putative Radical SAM domain protein n=1 Tax=uncultured Alphaproteobacteria bacterium TaxID=91750 RepID=A0A212JQ03_9PROT|nr:putative Radical SAM domain protein [uncultured Alphaproteobacteria bacterium]
MNILFCISQIDYADHIALAYLSAVAKQRGHSTFLCILAHDDLSSRVMETQADVVAYATNIQGFDEMVAAHKRARAQRNFVSIMGGPHVTFNPDTFAEAGVDAYCIGEGEYAFRDFLDRVAAGQSYDDVPNLITRAGRNPVRALIADLDEIPFPDRDLTLANTYLANTEKKTFYATRGCPFGCAYCCNDIYNAMYRGKGKILRRFGVDRILSEIEYVKARYRTEFVKFGDDLFAMHADDWLAEFAEAYPRRIGLPFNCYLRFDTVDEELLRLLKQAGCWSVHLSVDSASKHVRDDVLKRRMRNVDIVERLRMIHDAGINTWVNFMLAAPDSSLEDDLASIDIGRRGRVTYVSYSTTVPMRGTSLYDYADSRGLIDRDHHTSDMNGCMERSSLTCFSEKDKDIRYNIYLLGAIAAALPKPLAAPVMGAIRHLPPNRLFRAIRQKYYRHNIEHRIFKLS